jgi:hypothetical protein
MFDFYNVNEFDVLESVMISKKSKDDNLGDVWNLNSYFPGDGRDPELRSKRLLHYFVTRKPTLELSLRVPLQGTYQKKHNQSQLRKGVEAALPYDVVNGRRTTAHAEIDLLEQWIEPTEEGYSVIRLKKLARAAGLAQVPNGFTCLVREGGAAMFAVPDLETLRASRSSTFMRRENAIYLSIREGTEPRSNGCRYSLVYRENEQAR